MGYDWAQTQTFGEDPKSRSLKGGGSSKVPFGR